MRITGGKSRGISLGSPPGLKTRPASDSSREALFSALGCSIKGIKFADLFSGTGAYGLEAWSRGALQGTFVEMDRRCIRHIRKNISRVAKSASFDPANLEIVSADVFNWRSFIKHSFDIVFADPPYEKLKDIEEQLFNIAGELLASQGRLIIEHAADWQPRIAGWKPEKRLGKKRGRGPSLTMWCRKPVLDLPSKD